MEASNDLMLGHQTRDDEPGLRTADSPKWMTQVTLWSAACAVLVSVGTLYGVLTNPTIGQLRDDLMALKTQRDQSADALAALKDQIKNERSAAKQDHDAAIRKFDDWLALAERIESVAANTNVDGAAEIDVTKPDSAAVRTAVGQVLVLCENVQPYLDGYHLTFRLGNPTTAMLSGGTLHLAFGRQWAEQKGSWESWNTSLRKLDVSFVADLPAGAWTRLSLNIPRVAARDLAYFRVALTTDRFSLISADGK